MRVKDLITSLQNADPWVEPRTAIQLCVDASDKLEELNQRLEAIVNWCDLVRKNKDEFESHGVLLLEGPIFDAAREAIK